jgi:hypothetical protein
MSEIPKLDLMENRPCEHCGAMVISHDIDGTCVDRSYGPGFWRPLGSKYSPLGELSTREKLNRVLLELEPDALKAVLFLSERLLVGQGCYGKLDLSTDPRDWKKEKMSEVGDLLIYSAFETLKAAMEKC